MMNREYIYSLIDLFFPEICPGCGEPLSRGEEDLCIRCLGDLPETGFYNQPDNPVYKKFIGRFDFTQAAACYYFQKSSVVQNIIHHFKYKGKKETALFMGRQMGRLLAESPSFELPDAIVPVPLHPRKKKARGYNQSELLGMGMSTILNVEVQTGVLTRKTQTRTQTHLNAVQRWQNVKDAFGLLPSLQLHGQHLLLVDDVVTSGATVESCAHILSKLRNVKISMLALAMAEY